MIQAIKNFRAFPPQVRFIIGNEACERFSFYGMRSILVIFMIQNLKMPEETSRAVYHLFGGAVYLMPLAGAYLADRFLGKFRTILYLSIFYCLGHLALALWENQTALYIGLTLIAIGSGGIKPCVSAYVGDQFTQENKHLLQRVFDLFYWSINFGSVFSSLLIPWILPTYGARVAFAIPGILMAIATLLFWFGRKVYINIPPTGKTGPSGFMPVFIYALTHQKKKKPTQGFFDVALDRYTAEEVDGARAVVSIFRVFFTVSVFWALFDQSGSSWVLQGQQMEQSVFGFPVRAAQMQAINPALVLMLIPFFGGVVYPAVRRWGFQVTPLRKMSVGMFFAALSFVGMGMIQALLDSGEVLSVGWQFIPYLIITCSEVMISIPGLEFAYTQAPPSMKSTIMGFWLVTVFVGNLLDAYVAEMNVFQGATYFYFFAALMAAVAIVFVIGASRYKLRNGALRGSGTLATV